MLLQTCISASRCGPKRRKGRVHTDTSRKKVTFSAFEEDCNLDLDLEIQADKEQHQTSDALFRIFSANHCVYTQGHLALKELLSISLEFIFECISVFYKNKMIFTFFLSQHFSLSV